MQKSEAIQNHKIKPEEAGYYHVMFTKILKVGKRTIDEFHVVLYTNKEFNGKGGFKEFVDKNGLNATGFDEYEVVHDPTQVKASTQEDDKEKAEAKEKMKSLLKKDEGKVKDELKAYLTEKGVKFHPNMGLAKLKALKEEN